MHTVWLPEIPQHGNWGRECCLQQIVDKCLSLLDLTAAFDTVDDELLSFRLERQFDLRGTVLQWFKSYDIYVLCRNVDRAFRVLYGGLMSSVVHCAQCLSQGCLFL